MLRSKRLPLFGNRCQFLDVLTISVRLAKNVVVHVSAEACPKCVPFGVKFYGRLGIERKVRNLC
jgi:hypothetical protein